MKRTPKKTLKAVHILTDAEPRFVSLVGHGANQTPFNVVKLDPNAQRVAAETPATGAEPMSKKVVAAAPKAPVVKAEAAAGKPEIQSMAFAAEHFADEAAVRSYLTEHQYEDGITITKSDGGFVVIGHDEAEFEDGSLSVITHANVKITVGKLKAEAEGAAKTATTDSGLPPAAAAEPGAAAEAPAGGEQAAAPASAVQRTAVEAVIAGDPTAEEMDAAIAVLNEGIATVQKYTGLNEVLQYMDDVPVGFYDLMSAFGVICRYACRNKEYEKITKAAKELGGYIVSLAAMFEAPDGEAKGAASTETPAAKAPALPDAVAAAAQPAVADAPASDDDRIAAAVAKAVGPLTEQIKTLQESVDKASAPAPAVSGIEVSRKGAEELEPVSGTNAKPEGDKGPKENAIKAAIPKDRLSRNLIGF